MKLDIISLFSLNILLSDMNESKLIHSYFFSAYVISKMNSEVLHE